MTGSAERRSFWQRTLPGWDAGFAVLLALSGLSMLTGEHPTGDRVLVAALLAVLLVAYLLLARPGALRGDHRLTTGYLAVMLAVVSVCTAVNSLGSILLFVGFAQIWYFATGLRQGTVLSVLLTAGVAVANVWRVRPQGIEIAQLAGQYAVGLGFSLALGFWLTRVAEQNEVLAELIEEIERTRSASAAAQHRAGVLAERERVAERVHDTLAQGFTSIVVLAQAARTQLAAGDAAGGRDTAGELERIARAHLAESRALVAAFGSPTLEEAELGEVLDRLLTRFHAETGIRITVDVPPVPVSRDTEVVLLRGVQEVLVTARDDGPAHLVLDADGTVRRAADS